jgi:DNA repair ATPase RecN
VRVQKTAICVTNARRRVRGRPNTLAVDTCDLLHSEDAFEARMARFQQALSAQDDDSSPYEFLDGKGGCILRTLRHLRKATWGGGTQRGKSDDDDDDDSLFTSLIDFREEIKAAEARMVSAHSAYESLASLTAPKSALVALENVRKLLLGISADDGGPLFEAIEKTHELLNDVESSMSNCARSIDGGLMSTLEKMAFTGIPLEVVDGIIADWNTLARKHGISVSGSRNSMGCFYAVASFINPLLQPYSLPNCHMSMREELDGNVEAIKVLPEAKEMENIARADYSRACRVLSAARKEVATKLSQSVSNILPSLGLDGASVHVQLSTRSGGFEDPYYGMEAVGVDIAEFQLIHHKNANGVENGGSSSVSSKLELSSGASSGEKSRVLLAIETALPGSIGSTCNSFSSSAEHAPGQQDAKLPLAIIYDEIDAHVGGRAAVTMAKLLSDQSRVRRSRDRGRRSERGSQIIAITHSASLAAIADRHIVVERCLNRGSKSAPVRTYVVDGSSRRREIARMASGDLASDEAETFADALIRDAMLHREMSSS